MLIFPVSPIWADMSREPLWRAEVNKFDSGLRQGATIFSRPLYRYILNGKNMNEVKQALLENFWNDADLKGMTSPFLMKDPYAYLSESVIQATSTDMTSGDGFYFRQVDSWTIIPDSAAIYIEDPRSGEMISTSHYVMSQDNGWCHLLVPVSSHWVSSFEYFRKVAFESTLNLSSPVWNIFSLSGLVIEELLPNTG